MANSPTLRLALLLLLLLLGLLAAVAQATSSSSTYLQSQIYADLLAGPCIRVLNATGPLGCSSDTVSGAPLRVSSQDELAALAKGPPPTDDSVLLLPFELLTRENVRLARSVTQIKGLIVVEGSPRGTIPSYGSPCPSCDGTFVTNDWNPTGSALAYDDLTGFPMFSLLNTTSYTAAALATIQSVISLNAAANGPRRVIDLVAYMSGAHDANDCLRRNFCKPIGGQSVYAAFTPPNAPTNYTAALGDKDAVLLTASLDATAMFHDWALGSAERLAGVAALLTAAAALSSVDQSAWQRHVYFGLFTGESWGHVGSRAFARDLDGFKCKIPFTASATGCPYIAGSCTSPCMLDVTFSSAGMSLARVSHIIDANRLGGSAADLRIHVAGITGTSAGQLFPNTTVSTVGGLPPSPAVAFLRRKREIAAYVVSTLTGSTFRANTGTEYDDAPAATLADGACAAASAMARGAATLARGGTNTTVGPVVNCTLTTQLLTCLSTGTGCPFGLALDTNLRPSSYASIGQFGQSPGWPAVVASTVLANVTANVRGASCGPQKPACPVTAPSCIDGTCINALVRYHLGVGEGLAINEATGLWSVVDPTKPHFVESDWDGTAVGLRAFATISTGMEVVQLVLGIAVVVLTATVSKVMSSRYGHL
ncbi:Nicastrin-domain-containing protein [Blastocladiella britannica]|nr:Nicastrin-domain-containing protein [Blastocladiella britannica]